MGRKVPKSTVLTPAEEAIMVAFRQKTLLPLDDVPGCLRDTIPNLGRSALHRCLQRHGISRLPAEETKEQRKRFKTYQVGYVHIDSCELRHADGRLNLPQKRGGGLPLADTPVLTDNGMAFADLPRNRTGPGRRFLRPAHLRARLHCQRDRAPVDQTLSPVDQWPGRTDKPHHQGRNDEGLSLRRPAEPQRPMSWPSSPPTTSPSTSRSCDGERPTRSYARPGPRTRQPSKSTRTTSLRDHTSRNGRCCS